MEKKYNDNELFVELNQAIEELEREAASKIAPRKKVVNIHCRQNGQFLFTRSVTVEEED